MTDAGLFSMAGLGSPSDNPQWRLVEVQVANWGTFDGQIYTIPVARSGHLITGSSGSGKSTLLDGIAAVLTPDKWLRLNAAAQGIGSRADQRSLISYVRGAWQRQADEDEDRIVTQYLRPKATWSGVLLRYRDGAGKSVTLARLFFAKGSGTGRSDLSSLRFLDQSDVDLADLQDFARSGLQTRRIKDAYPKATVTPTAIHSAFFVRLRSTFGIRSEGALNLLHKTQSTKNLGSLDQLFRDYMLDLPTTFKVADNAIEQFGELFDAHEHVVELRKQRDLLEVLRAASSRYDEGALAAKVAARLSENVERFRAGLELELAEVELAAENVRARTLEDQGAKAEAAYVAASERKNLAYQASVEKGAGLANQALERLDDARLELLRTEEQWRKLDATLAEVGITHTPGSAAEFAELQAQVNLSSAAAQEVKGPSHGEQERLTLARQRDQKLEAELDSLRRSKSTVPQRLQDIRAALATALGLPPSTIPFAAEMIEVDPQFEEWTGAIERVLRPFALTLLVRSAYLPATRRWVDSHNLRERLVYEEVGETPAPVRKAASDVSLVNRVSVSVSKGALKSWVESQLSQRYDYACVETPDELGRYQKAVTVNGQVRQSSTRYMKDDRHAVSNRSHWLLGDSEAKMEALVGARRDSQRELQAAETVVARADQRLRDALTQAATLRHVGSYNWSDIDVTAAKRKVEGRRQRYEELVTPSSELQGTLDALQVAKAELEKALEALTAVQAERQALEIRRAELSEEIEQMRPGCQTPLDSDVKRELNTRFHAGRRTLNKVGLSTQTQRVTSDLRKEEGEALAAVRVSGEEISSVATKFKERWPGTASSLTASVDDRASFIEIYDDIVARGLPEHEDQFLRLLRERSRDLVGDLRSEILGAAVEVREKIEPINASLSASEFDPGRYLRLRVRSTRPSAAEEFLGQLRDISEGSWGDADLDAAERRFLILSQIMTDLGSSETEKKAWRRQCLDTRLHVSFVAEEVDVEGRVLASHESGTALSGGQQQKLVFFCLAAALRYQLADLDQAFPSYATVVLDEAFDKADADYTRTALRIFDEFGLHLVLATPQKLLQTIEPFIGGATEIENPTRKKSQVAAVMWEDE